MIQLANDPHASRSFSRAAANDPGRETSDARRARSGHAWPVLSRMESRPAREQDSPKPAAKDNGS